MLDALKARMLLDKCIGDEIWTVDDCRAEGVPEDWIEELSDAFESGFVHDRQTIYKDGAKLNQYHGVQDLHLAYKLAEFLGVDSKQTTATALGRIAEVKALQEAADEE